MWTLPHIPLALNVIRKFLTNDNSYHFFAIVKTRLGYEISDNFMIIPGYSTFKIAIDMVEAPCFS